MNCPPTKRFKGLNQDVVTAVVSEDPFGDDEEFTQADLDEIDILASQATSAAAAAPSSKQASKVNNHTFGASWPSSTGTSKSLRKNENNRSTQSTLGFNVGHTSSEFCGSMHGRIEPDRDDSYRRLEAQHTELKRKLKEVEDQIMLKSGEIRVLRDSLKAAQQEKEAQKQNQILMETQRQKEQSDREKELNRKVQSLQSELQFKEAEINDMKGKLSSEKNKTVSPVARNSPRVISTLAPLHHGTGSSSASPTGNGFLTKEAFGARTSLAVTPVKTQRDGDRGASCSRSGDGHEMSHPDPFLSVRPAHLQHRGAVLLGLLLQQPKLSSKPGLSHLLSMSPADFNQLSIGPLVGSALEGAGAAGSPRASLNLVQSLAATGLNMLSQKNPAVTSRKDMSCSGAVLLLPLLDLHLSQLCCALDSHPSSSAGSSDSDATAAGPPVSASPGSGRLEEPGVEGFSMEDTGLTALRLLYHLVTHSDEVVEAVLLKENLDTDNKTDTHMGVCSHNALLQSLLRLCDTRLCGSSSQKNELILNALKTLCVLIKRTPHTHSNRLQCVLQVMHTCLSADVGVPLLSESVSVLMAMCDRQSLVKLLCSKHDSCVFLRLFQLIRTRPDNQKTHSNWVLLDLQVVRLLSRLTQRAESWMNHQQSTCQCYAELVQTIVIVLHRQWLDLRSSQETLDSAGLTLNRFAAPRPPWWSSPAALLLRESLLLLHWLLLHHSSFSESCRPLLHMYDQMIPAVRETLKKIPELSESEELALEEICRSEGDDADDMDTES